MVAFSGSNAGEYGRLCVAQNAQLGDELPDLVLDRSPLRKVRNLGRPIHPDPAVPVRVVARIKLDKTVIPFWPTSQLYKSRLDRTDTVRQLASDEIIFTAQGRGA